MKVAISGYYGFDNSGDEAILEAIVLELKKLGHEPLVLSNNPEQTAQKYKVKAFQRMKPLEIWRAISSCDIFISGGGGLLQDKTSKKNLIYYLSLLRLAVFLGKRAVVFNQSIGPLSKSGERWVSRLLRHRKIEVIVRDKKSKDYLSKLGIAAQLGADPALLLPIEQNIIKEDTIIIAPRAGYPEATAKLLELTKKLQKNGYRITIIGLHKGVDKGELEKFAILPGITTVETDGATNCLSIIQSAKVIIGIRLHALILAAAANRPFIGLSYDPKVSGFCQDANSPCFDLDFSVDDVLNSVENISELDQSSINEMKMRAKKSFSFID